jgi:hypothetical protein
MSQLDPPGIIQSEHLDGRAPARIQAPDAGTSKGKVARPIIAPWVKQYFYGTGQRVDPTQIWALSKVTSMAGQRKVIKGV